HDSDLIRANEWRLLGAGALIAWQAETDPIGDRDRQAGTLRQCDYLRTIRKCLLQNGFMGKSRMGMGTRARGTLKGAVAST
ncbi:hypothetical protein, partial [Anabaena sp. CCY 9614]|uniref:hypothetical protein n=1 Tax=Anabaena sp. CCY 9614 TaxID=3103869 RepID=UPI0039C6A456